MKLHLHLPTLLCCLALLLGTVLHADDHVLRETLSLGLPVICVETVNHEFPSFDRIDPPDGCWGIGITNATKVPGRLTMYATDGTVTYESGEYQKNASGMTIKVRGNTSAFWLKRPSKSNCRKRQTCSCGTTNGMRTRTGCSSATWASTPLRASRWVSCWAWSTSPPASM